MRKIGEIKYYKYPGILKAGTINEKMKENVKKKYLKRTKWPGWLGL